MITLLYGDNNFELTRELEQITRAFDGRVEKIDGSEVQLSNLPDLLFGQSLFADKRVVIIKNLSENKSVWSNLADWFEKISDDTQLILVETTPDKRTKTFKELQKSAEVKEFKSWTDRDVHLAEAWVVKEAAVAGLQLDKKLAQLLVERVGLDQWQLYHAVEKLAVFKSVNEAVIREVIPLHPHENILQLFEVALKGDVSQVQEMIETIRLRDEPFQVFGLVTGQVFQLAALSVADKPSAEVAKDFGVHPFVASKFAPYAKKLGPQQTKKIVALFAEADSHLKTSATDPWIILEKSLIETAAISSQQFS